MKRRRLQVDLAPRHQKLLKTLGGHVGDGDAETTRRVFDLMGNLADQIQQGFKLVVVLSDDEHPDALPELTRALAPEYTYLVRRPHKWRKQLSFKGRRLTVGHLIASMRTEKWTPKRAAQEFDLPIDAVSEALDYARRYAELIEMEEAEDAKAAKSLMRASSAR